MQKRLRVGTRKLLSVRASLAQGLRDGPKQTITIARICKFGQSSRDARRSMSVLLWRLLVFRGSTWCSLGSRLTVFATLRIYRSGRSRSDSAPASVSATLSSSYQLRRIGLKSGRFLVTVMPVGLSCQIWPKKPCAMVGLRAFRDLHCGVLALDNRNRLSQIPTNRRYCVGSIVCFVRSRSLAVSQPTIT